MSSTHAIRKIEKHFESVNATGTFYKDAAINARSPGYEATDFEREFLQKLHADKRLEKESSVRRIDGKLFLAILRRGEVMEASCLRCHGDPQGAPGGRIDFYGPSRSCNRNIGEEGPWT
jgi:hypothetical protein